MAACSAGPGDRGRAATRLQPTPPRPRAAAQNGNSLATYSAFVHTGFLITVNDTSLMILTISLVPPRAWRGPPCVLASFCRFCVLVCFWPRPLAQQRPTVANVAAQAGCLKQSETKTLKIVCRQQTKAATLRTWPTCAP